MLMRRMPDEAKPVAHALKQDGYGICDLSHPLDWKLCKNHDVEGRAHLRCLNYCYNPISPIGFHRQAKIGTPRTPWDFFIVMPPEFLLAVRPFADWWDDQTDAAAALAEIERVQREVA